MMCTCNHGWPIPISPDIRHQHLGGGTTPFASVRRDFWPRRRHRVAPPRGRAPAGSTSRRAPASDKARDAAADRGWPNHPVHPSLSSSDHWRFGVELQLLAFRLSCPPASTAPMVATATAQAASVVRTSGRPLVAFHPVLMSSLHSIPHPGAHGGGR